MLRASGCQPLNFRISSISELVGIKKFDQRGDVGMVFDSGADLWQEKSSASRQSFL
jgi:hypothetical protein